MSRNRLRDSRRYLGFTLEEVARHLRTDPEAVDLMEQTGSVGQVTLWRLAQLYRRTPGYLMGTESPPPVSDCVERMISARKLSESDAGELREFGRLLASGPSRTMRAHP